MYGELRFASTRLKDAGSSTPQPAVNYKADKYIEMLYNQLKKFIHSKDTAIPNVTMSDYHKYRKIVDDYNPQTLINDIQKLQGDEALDYSQSVFNAFDYLKASIPYRSQQTLLGPKQLEPSDKEKLAWARKAKAIDDPLSVLSNGLTNAEIEAMQVAYPRIYETMQQQAIALLAESPELSVAKSREIGKLLGIPIQQDRAIQMQSSYQTTESYMTPTQQANADYKQPMMTPGAKMQSDLIGQPL